MNCFGPVIRPCFGVLTFWLLIIFHAFGSTPPGAVRSMLAKQSMNFEENRGQWPSSTKFVARKGVITVVLETDGISFREGRRDLFRIRFEGASQSVALTGEERLPAHHNYYIGNDPRSWKSWVPAFQSVLYQGLYEGVDLRVCEDTGRLEYDLLVKPGADLSRVVLHAAGASSLALESDGAMRMRTAHGVVRQTAPRTWEVHPDGTRQPLESHYRSLVANATAST